MPTCVFISDLTNPDTFRDLSKPIGAMTQSRLEQFQVRRSVSAVNICVWSVDGMSHCKTCVFTLIVKIYNLKRSGCIIGLPTAHTIIICFSFVPLLFCARLAIGKCLSRSFCMALIIQHPVMFSSTWQE